MKIKFYKNDIYKYLKQNENDSLSSFKGSDLQDLLILIDDYQIPYRKRLAIDEGVTFGLELEFENCNRSKINTELIKYFKARDDAWRIVSDCSLDSGAEVVTSILTDNNKTWKDLESVCEFLQKHSTIGFKAGSHIHVGSHLLGNKKENWLQLIKIWSIYENIIFKFFYGEYLTPRPELKHYAKPRSRQFWDIYELHKCSSYTTKSLLQNVSRNRDQALNFKNVDIDFPSLFSLKNTIEFRSPNGTLNPIVWQNNVNLAISILKYSSCSDFDHDILNSRKNMLNFNEMDLYNEVFLSQALEFSDLIFSTNLDKINFLRQYLKSFKVNKKEFEKCDSFVKILKPKNLQ